MNYENILKLKKVSSDEVESKIIETAQNFYGFASNDIEDYLSDISSYTCDYIEEENMIVECFENHIEFTKTGKAPEIVKWYDVYYYNDLLKYESVEYFKHEKYFY